MSVLGFALSAIDAVRQVKELRRWPMDVGGARVRQLRTDQLAEVTIADGLVQSGYEILRDHERPLLTSRAVNSLLAKGADGALRVQRRLFDSSHVHATAREKLISLKRESGAAVFDGAKVRLCDDLRVQTSDTLEPVRLERTTYFRTLVTNDSVNYEVFLDGRHSPVYSGRDTCFPGGVVASLSESDASNQIGASTLAISADNRLVIMRSGARSAVEVGRLASSGSGSADWKDVEAQHTIAAFARRVALRELTEELGINPADVLAFGVIGYGRFIDRGGKPEFFCVARLSLPYSKLKIRRPERMYMERSESPPLDDSESVGRALQLAVRKLLQDSEELSASLYWNLRLVEDCDTADLDEILGAQMPLGPSVM